MINLLKLLTFIMPWSLRRRALEKWFGYQIHPTARIGLSWVFPRELVMDAFSKIEHFTVAIHLDLIKMNTKSSIGRGNWITGFSTIGNHSHFKHQIDRHAELLLGESAAITKYHHLDCTNRIEIGKFTTIAGYHSQLLTHSINILENRQDSFPIYIGEYAFIGTNVVLIGGAYLPSYSVLSAKSLLNKRYNEERTLYGGVPAKPIKAIPITAKYFTRTEGFVY
ncbi:acyltransferase [Spirosoma sp. KCTC 42546]|uniref:acyltransferase n=1 Tax=Spirosoma sp. KCTC 42546 TaxID=2520506 RepID=UPI0011577516|nr:acyltransferase [Spirosoma sp. KCTC 42546]QDK78670.1 acyltransferase [Spirosoma sp. KCTC 42546]